MGDQDAIIAAIQISMTQFQASWRQDIERVHNQIRMVCARIESLERDRAARDAVSSSGEKSLLRKAQDGAVWALSGAVALYLLTLVLKVKV